MSLTAEALEYWFPATLTPREVVEQLATVLGVTVEGREESERVLLDTFDWRLFCAGTGIEQRRGDGSAFRWYRLADGRTRYQSPGEAPRFAWDLPAGAFRRALEKQIEMRALLPRARLRARSTHLALRDHRQKRTLQLYVEEPTLLGRAEIPLRPRLRLEPVRGYSEVLARAQLDLVEALSLQPAKTPLLSEVLSHLHVTPGAYSSKVRVELAAEMPAGEAARVLLLHLLDTMEANEDGTIAATDSEFLHDFRVSVRRTRSALGQFKKVLPGDVRARFREEFAWLGSITGSTRVLDVYLLTFPEYQGSLPREVRDDLGPLHAFLQRLQRREQGILAKALRSKRYRSLKREWRQFLESDIRADAAPAGAELPVIEVASSRIWKIYERVLRKGAGLGPDSPAEDFHELRKTCKQLRYLLEFFQSIFPPKPVGAVIKTLKSFQDNLGTYNDLDVQAEAMQRFGRLMQEAGEAPAECLIAMGMLTEDLIRRQAATRSEFAARFAGFADRKTQRKVRKLFAPGGQTPDAGAKG